MSIWKHVRFDKAGLLPAVIVDDQSGQVLTLCYMNRAALQKTLKTGQVHVYRRTQRKLMKKGAISGHTQAVRKLFIDCDGDSLLIRVTQKVAACHKGRFSCYFSQYDPKTGKTRTVGRRVFNPDDVY